MQGAVGMPSGRSVKIIKGVRVFGELQNPDPVYIECQYTKKGRWSNSLIRIDADIYEYMIFLNYHLNIAYLYSSWKCK